MNYPFALLKLSPCFLVVTIVCGVISLENKAAAQASGQSTNFTVPSTAGTSSGGASQAGSSSSMVQLAGAGVNVAMGAYMATQCSVNKAACLMAAQAAMQAGSLLTASGGSGQAGNGMASDGTSTTAMPNMLSAGTASATTGATTPTVTTPTSAAAVSTQLAALNAALTKAGVAISPDGSTVTLPDGSTAPSSASGSAGLSSAGFTPSQISQAQALEKDAMIKFGSQIKAVQMAAQGSEGDGGGGNRGPASEPVTHSMLFGKMPWDKAGKDGKAKASVTGMSKKLGADNIGVAGDNIFDMVTRRYKTYDAKNGFIK